MKVLLAFDKFRGTATSEELASTCNGRLRDLGVGVDSATVSDGGDSLGRALGAVPHRAVVQGPLGVETEARWYSLADQAVVETSSASGLSVIGGALHNLPIQAHTFGTGQLIVRAYEAGYRSIIVGCGGSATTDGGAGALRAVMAEVSVSKLRLSVLSDVKTEFSQSAEVFAPQKGATREEVTFLSQRLQRLAEIYSSYFGRDVRGVEGAGAAGGLAGGLYAAGARICRGFEFVAQATGLESKMQDADLIITGEGKFDSSSLTGKVTGEILKRATYLGKDVVVVAGQVERDVTVTAKCTNATVLSLEEMFGPEAARARTVDLVAEIVVSIVSTSI